MDKKCLAILINVVMLSFSHSALAFPQTSEAKPAVTSVAEDVPQDDIERVVVYGQKTVFQLRKEIFRKTKDFFKDYNKVNKVNHFAMVCIKESQPSTNFKATKCEPRYVKTNRSKINHATLYGGGHHVLQGVGRTDGQVNLPVHFSRIGAVSQEGKLFASQNQDFQNHVTELMKENPELIGKYNELMDLQDEFEYKKENK